MSAKKYKEIGLALYAVGAIIAMVSQLNIIAFIGTELNYISKRYFIELIVGLGIYLIGGVFRIIGLCIEHRRNMHVPLIDVITEQEMRQDLTTADPFKNKK